MQKMRNIFLIGPRACGKTHVGQALAERLGRDFVDTDHALAEVLGTEISGYVKKHGWDVFREEEARTLRRVAVQGGRVIGCGGGIVLREENRDVLAEGIVIYLRVEPEELARRLAANPLTGQRPSLTGKPVIDEVREVLAARSHLYEGCAHHIIDGGDLDETVEAAYQAVRALF